MKRLLLAAITGLVLCSGSGCCLLDRLFCCQRGYPPPYCSGPGCGDCGPADCGCASNGPVDDGYGAPGPMHAAGWRRSRGGGPGYGGPSYGGPAPGYGAYGGPAGGQVAYPYYTTRGPRDFLSPNPRSIGPY